MDINISPTVAAPTSAVRPVVVRTIVQYREADSDTWVSVAETSQQASQHLSSALRSGGVMVSAALRAHAQPTTPAASALPPPIEADLDLSGTAATAPVQAPAAASAEGPSLAFQDRIMQCIDRYAPPGYLTSETLKAAVPKLSIWAASEIFVSATNGFNKGRIKDLPAAISAVKQSTKTVVQQNVDEICDVLRAVALDEQVRGPIRDALKVAEADLKRAEEDKRSRLPSHLSSTMKAKWVKDDPKVKALKVEAERLQSALKILPSQRAQAAAPADAQEPLIDL